MSQKETLAPLTDPQLTLLERLSQPIWISDVDTWRYRWANPAALSFWHAKTLEELVDRRTEASETVRTTFFHVRERARAGEIVRIDHTVYPDGLATRIQTFCSAYPLPDGKVGLLHEVQRAPVEIDPEVLRSSEAVRYAPLVVTTHALDGTTLAANALARRTLGDRFGLRDIFADAAQADGVLFALAAGERVSCDAAVKTLQGRRWMAIEARRIPDPVTGDDAVVVSAHDVTGRREAELAKDELISVVSHELRTPLTAIRGALSLLVHRHVLDAAAVEDELVRIATENAARLGRLLDDLLDVQRIGVGRIELARSPASLHAVVERAITLLGPMAQASDVRLVFGCAAPDVVADMDAGRILQVLSNLLSNAIKHSPRGGEVRVEMATSAAKVRVRVVDRGPGIPPSFRDRIFGRFAQADTSDTRAVGGAGLGLYIARTLVEHHGGQLAFEEEMEGGAAFFFELPLSC